MDSIVFIQNYSSAEIRSNFILNIVDYYGTISIVHAFCVSYRCEMCNSYSPSISLLFFSLRILSCQCFLISGCISCLIEKVILLMSSGNVYPCQPQLEGIPKPWQNVSGLYTSNKHKVDPFFHNFHQDTLNLVVSYVPSKQADFFNFSTFWWFFIFWYIYKRYPVIIINFIQLYSITRQISLVFTWQLLDRWPS